MPPFAEALSDICRDFLVLGNGALPPLHAHATTIRSGGHSGNNGFDYSNGGSSNNGGEQVVEASAVSSLRFWVSEPASFMSLSFGNKHRLARALRLAPVWPS